MIRASRNALEGLKQSQKGIYGTDDRQDIYEIEDAQTLELARSVGCIFFSFQKKDIDADSYRLKTNRYGPFLGLCESERFYDQPIVGSGTAFYVGDSTIITAAHCVPRNIEQVRKTYITFDFEMVAQDSPREIFTNSRTLQMEEVVGEIFTQDGPDWAVVRTKTDLSDTAPLSVRRSGKISDSQNVFVIGHPVGLPKKVASGGAYVRSNSFPSYFIANLDTYGGNSGSPVFNADTFDVEGILVRGDTDFIEDSSTGCNVSMICPTTGCEGEDCTRTTELQHLI